MTVLFKITQNGRKMSKMVLDGLGRNVEENVPKM